MFPHPIKSRYSRFMSQQLRIFWIGLLIYVVSFFLIAAQFVGLGNPSPWFGFFAAFYAFLLPLDGMIGHGAPFHSYIEWTALLVSGWINPVFVIAAFLDLTGQYKRTVAVLRTILLLMIPFCWVFFTSALMYPREGHFLWIAGMLMVLFSKKIDQIQQRRATSS